MQRRRALAALTEGGRCAVVIGAAGSGKSALLSIAVGEWALRGRTVFGIALAWRQARDLIEAGIAEERTCALMPFLMRVANGAIRLDRNSVVVVDELGLLGTRDVLALLRLQRDCGFRFVAVGDDAQCASPSAGATIDLFRLALGSEAVPALQTSVRQRHDHEREIAALFREGRTADALALKRANNTAVLAIGTAEQAAGTVAEAWHLERTRYPSQSDHTVTVSAPTHAEARLIGIAIRSIRQQLGEIHGPEVEVDAVDALGTRHALRLAAGDRVRLHKRTNAKYGDGTRGVIGVNGSVLEVIEINPSGIKLKNSHGRCGLVSWKTLRTKDGDIFISYGDVMTIDAAQGLTSGTHITAILHGTANVGAGRAYVGASRHRDNHILIVADAAIRRSIQRNRPLGDLRPITVDDVWDHIAADLAKRPQQPLAVLALTQARTTQAVAEAGFRLASHEIEARPDRGPSALRSHMSQWGMATCLSVIVSALEAAVSRCDALVAALEVRVSARDHRSTRHLPTLSSHSSAAARRPKSPPPADRI